MLDRQSLRHQLESTGAQYARPARLAVAVVVARVVETDQLVLLNNFRII